MIWDPCVKLRWRRISCASFVLLWLLTVCARSVEAQSTEQIAKSVAEPQNEQASLAHVGEGDLELGPGDTVGLRMVGEEEVSRDWRISESGYLSLPLVGGVSVSGMTARKLEADLTERYQRYIRDPQIRVSVVELRSRPVTVTGAIRNPGVYQLRGGSTLNEVLALAGGVVSPGTKVAVTRRKASGTINFPGSKWVNQGEEMTVDLDLQAVVSGRGQEAGFRLRPFDMVNVAENTTRRIYVAGEVNLPGPIQLVQSDSIRLTQAIAMAGGYKSSGKISQAVVWTGQGNGGRGEMAIVDLKGILKGTTEDRLLREGDYLIIPPKGTPIAYSIAMLISPVASLMMVFAVGK